MFVVFFWPKFVHRNEVMLWAGRVEYGSIFALYPGHLGDFTVERLHLEEKSSNSLLSAIKFVIAVTPAAF